MKAIIWSKDNCPACYQAVQLLKFKGCYEIEVKKIDGTNVTIADLHAVVPGARSVPQIFVDDKDLTSLKSFLK